MRDQGLVEVRPRRFSRLKLGRACLATCDVKSLNPEISSISIIHLRMNALSYAELTRFNKYRVTGEANARHQRDSRDGSGANILQENIARSAKEQKMFSHTRRARGTLIVHRHARAGRLSRATSGRFPRARRNPQLVTSLLARCYASWVARY